MPGEFPLQLKKSTKLPDKSGTVYISNVNNPPRFPVEHVYYIRVNSMVFRS